MHHGQLARPVIGCISGGVQQLRNCELFKSALYSVSNQRLQHRLTLQTLSTLTVTRSACLRGYPMIHGYLSIKSEVTSLVPDGTKA